MHTLRAKKARNSDLSVIHITSISALICNIDRLTPYKHKQLFFTINFNHVFKESSCIELMNLHFYLKWLVIFFHVEDSIPWQCFRKSYSFFFLYTNKTFDYEYS